MTAKSGFKKFPPEFLQKIREKVNLVEIVGEHVVLRKSGSNYSGLCPFHNERSPSFSVSENKQLFHCYGCKKGGDVFGFVQEIFGTSFPEAVADLAERAQIAMPSDYDAPSNEDPEVQRKRAAAREKLQTASKLNRFVAAFYRQQLESAPPAEQYFRKRGVFGDVARDFYVGYAPAAWDQLAAHLAAKQAPLALAVELGLIRPSTSQNARAHGSGYFDLFRSRAMFPILDMRGKVAGFGGRQMPAPEGSAGDADGASSPKYLNSSESLLFQKSRLAFGLYQAQKHIRAQDEVIVVEGYFDVAALHTAGFRNVVATCGTSLTPEHLTIFRKFASKITVLFDGDRAGITATERAMTLGLEHGLVLYGASLPPDLDPDELLFDQETGQSLPDGVEKMSAILQASAPLLDTRIDAEVAQSGKSAEDRAQAIKHIGAWLAAFKDPVGRGVRAQLVRERLGVPASLLDQAAGRPVGGGGAPANEPGRRPQPIQVGRPRGGARIAAPKGLSGGERMLLEGLVLSQGSSSRAQELGRILSEFGPLMPPGQGISDLFEHPAAQALARRGGDQVGGDLRDLAGALDALGEDADPQVRSILTEALVGGAAAPGSPAELSAEDFRHALNRLTARAWARFSQQIKVALADAEAKKDAGLQAKLMKEYLDVQRKMKEFTTFYDEA